MNFGIKSEKIEFRENIKQADKGILSLIAMLNKSHEGTVYFGVASNGELKKNEINEKSARDLSQKISDGVVPKIIPTIEIKTSEGINYIVLSAKGYETPYSYKGEYRIRSADEDKKFPYELLKKYFISNSKDSIVSLACENQNLHFTQFKSMFVSRGVKLNSDDDSFLENESLVNREGKFNIQASLLADESSFSIKVAQFSTIDKEHLIKRTEFGYQSLALSMEQVLTYVDSFNDTAVLVNGSLSREEKKLFNRECFREAWVNACLHTSWEEGTPPIVYIYTNRIEIVSYGGLPLGLSIDDFYLGKQKVINQALLKIFGQLRYAETIGYGVPLIVKTYGKKAFTITENFITVTIPFAWEIFPESKINDKKLTKNESKIYSYLKKNQNASRDIISHSTDINEGSVIYSLKSLVNKGFIKRSGSKKDGYWVILEKSTIH